MSDNPHLDEVIPFEESRGILGFFRWIGLIGRLRAERFDACYLFHRSFTRALTVWLAGIPSRIGPATRKQAGLLTHPAVMPSKEEIHKAAWYMKIVEADGVAPDGPSYDLVLLSDDLASADRLLREFGIQPAEKFVAVHPGANWPPKRWSLEKFARLADGLRKKRGIKTVFIGGPDDLELVKRIRSLMQTEMFAATGKTSLRESAAILRRAAVLVSNDSGPLHMGAAVGTPVVGLFGPSDPRRYGPLDDRARVVTTDLWCRPCNRVRRPPLRCGDHVPDCMEGIEVEAVRLAAHELLISRG